MDSRQPGKRHKIELLNSSSTKTNGLPEKSFGLLIDNQLQMSFSVHYPLKESVVDVMDQLTQVGYKVSVLTGDPEPKQELQNIRWDYHNGLSPEGKRKFLLDTKNKGNTFCYIGDGINDLLVMAEADVSIAMFDGANKSKTTADFILFNPKFSTLPKLFSASVQADKIIRMNFFWATIYNFTGLSLAVLGFLNPLISILAMTLSSGFVTSNSLRLKKLNFTSE
ncbi:MAG: HAD-IC family P-type ATPase [Fodinibius sp.]|nr:HAD-IC family P-type ATPase [Fodinibius sp.]